MNVLLGNANPAEERDGEPYQAVDTDEQGNAVGDPYDVVPRVMVPLNIGETITRFGPFPTEGWTLREKVAAITSPNGGWKGHSLDDRPEWIASDNEAMLILLSEEWPDVQYLPWDEAVARYESMGGSL